MTIQRSVWPFFFSKTFYTWTSMTIPQSHRRMVTDIRDQKCVWKKNEKNPVCETVVWSLADRVNNLIEKKWPGLSDSDKVTGGLSISQCRVLLNFSKILIIFQIFLKLKKSTFKILLNYLITGKFYPRSR